MAAKDLEDEVFELQLEQSLEESSFDDLTISGKSYLKAE